MSDPSAGSHPAWPALEKGALWDHDPRLQAAWKHYSVCRHEHPRRQRDRRLHRSEEHTSELQSLRHLVCRLLLENKTWRGLLFSSHRLLASHATRALSLGIV